MTHETDLPCSECGTELVERTVDDGDLVSLTDAGTPVTVAECPSCGARFYPQETLTRLSNTSDGGRHRGDS